jgi:phenylalanyl-tRNA synthetase alpha chain
MPIPLLDGAALQSALSLRDLSDPAQGPHAIQLITDNVVAALTHHDRPTVDVRRGDRVVSTAENYDNLGYPPHAVTRDARYTKYVDNHHVLRSHTSALIPPALRALASSGDDDVLVVAPGVCYRRDTIDWQHSANPHQLDLWRLRRSGGTLAEDDLMAMIHTTVHAALPGAQWRTIRSSHPYTDDGRQIDARWAGQWIEIGECGLAATHVLAQAGLGKEWSGLAMGIGLDRLLMLRKGVPDIRLLRSTDPRIAGQMGDLAPYCPVSHQPSVRRDLSLAVGSDVDISVEALGDRIRDSLGADASLVESVAVLDATDYNDLPPTARQRLGIEPRQLNLLVRLVLRPVDRTLTDPEANLLRDRVYLALHEGSTAQLSCRSNE